MWQWIRHAVRLNDGREVTAGLVGAILEEETAGLRATLADGFDAARVPEARELFERVALSGEFVDFLTIPALEKID